MRGPDTTSFARHLLRTAVAVPSPSGSEGALVDRLARELRSRFAHVGTDDAGNLHARRGRGPRTVLFLGHVDTVPGDVPVEDDGEVLRGRGAVDAKGPLCAALAAAAELDDETAERLSVHVVGAVGEEAPGSVGARHLLTTTPAPDLLIVCEPSGWDAVTLGYKGSLRLALSAERDGGHSAGPDRSAGDLLVSAVARLQAAADEATPDAEGAFDALQATVLSLRHDHDGLRERAGATVGLRLPPAWPPDRTRALLAGLPLPVGVRVHEVEAVPAVRGARDGPLARAFRVALRGHGVRPRTLVKTGTSDWNVVAGAWPVPTLAYGPGDAALDHAPDEHVRWDDYERGVSVIGAALAHLGAAAADRG
jgi:LysW-gamma-L-lysine carboxypeptidase